MTKAKYMTKQQRKAHNKKRKTQRMRKLRRYARALQAVEYYIGNLLHEWLCPYELTRTDKLLTFQFGFSTRLVAYSLLTPVIEALNFKLESRRVRLNAVWTASNQWVFQALTIGKKEADRLQFQTRRIPSLELLEAIHI